MKPTRTGGNFRGCNRLIAAAKEVFECWETGDLAAAVRNLHVSMKEIDGDVDKQPREVVILIIEYHNGRNVYACEHEDRAIDELYFFVEEYWAELPGDVGKIPSEKLDAIEIYFQEKDGEESYEMQALPLLTARGEA